MLRLSKTLRSTLGKATGRGAAAATPGSRIKPTLGPTEHV